MQIIFINFPFPTQIFIFSFMRFKFMTSSTIHNFLDHQRVIFLTLLSVGLGSIIWWFASCLTILLSQDLMVVVCFYFYCYFLFCFHLFTPMLRSYKTSQFFLLSQKYDLYLFWILFCPEYVVYMTFEDDPFQWFCKGICRIAFSFDVIKMNKAYNVGLSNCGVNNGHMSPLKLIFGLICT